MAIFDESKLNPEKFDKIVEQLKPDKKMATTFKPFWEFREEKAEKRGIEKGIEKERKTNNHHP